MQVTLASPMRRRKKPKGGTRWLWQHELLWQICSGFTVKLQAWFCLPRMTPWGSFPCLGWDLASEIMSFRSVKLISKEIQYVNLGFVTYLSGQKVDSNLKWDPKGLYSGMWALRATPLNWAPKFEWYMAMLVVKNDTNKMCYYEIGLWLNIDTNLGYFVNTNGRAYVISWWESKSWLWPLITFASQFQSRNLRWESARLTIVDHSRQSDHQNHNFMFNWKCPQ